MEKIRIEVSIMLANRIKTLKGIADQINVSEPTLRKIKKMDKTVSYKKVQEVKLLLKNL